MTQVFLTKTHYPVSSIIDPSGASTAAQKDYLMDTKTLCDLFERTPHQIRREREYSRNDLSDPLRFPLPTKIGGRNYWKFYEVRRWEIARAKYNQKLYDILDITEAARKSTLDAVKQCWKDIETKLWRSVR
jgi:hypothetical protein